MIGRGDVKVHGVLRPETALDPGIYNAELAKREILVHEQHTIMEAES